MEVNKDKMEELLQLIEELVVNKIRIKKIEDEVKDSEVKKVLSQEVQVVSKIQDVVKKIQTENMNIIYSNLEGYLGEKINRLEFVGLEAEFDNYNESYIFETLKAFIDDELKFIEDLTSDKINVTAKNDSSNIIIEISNKKSSNIREFMDKEKKSYLNLVDINVDEIEEWLKEVYLQTVSLNGAIEIFLDEDFSQRIVIIVPLSSSIIKAQLVEINNQTYAIPMESIEKVMNINSSENRVSNGVQLINYMGSIIPIIPIDKNLGLSLEKEFSHYVVLKMNQRMKALPVNSLLEQTDVVVRSKPKIIQDIKEFKGMAVLGDGYVTMVFDIGYILGINHKEEV